MNDTLSEMTVAKPRDEKKNLLDWWFGTVLLTFFPIITAVLVGLLRGSMLVVLDMIENGDIILSSFLICAPSILTFDRKKQRETPQRKLMYYLLLFCASLQLIAYTVITTNESNNWIIVCVVSVLCVVSSILIARSSEKMEEMSE